MGSLIKLLSEFTINRIAAGEVIERPASAVKELVENSIDAGATEITIHCESGGRNFISITDNGCGMDKEDIELSILRHSTSKLDENNINNINFFGFRGEALPSIASISRMKISSKSRNNETDHGWLLEINGGKIESMAPSPISKGTKIEVKDLFFATPARLKFLRSERVESQAIVDVVKKIAMANPLISFKLVCDNKTVLDLKAEQNMTENLHLSRISEILGEAFKDNSSQVDRLYEEVSLTGFVSIPTFNKSTNNDLHLYVNNRPVKDKILISAVKVAYQDYLAPNRSPVVVLFLNLSPNEVDVNVHPSKIEVRFKDPNLIRKYIISSIREALLNKSQSTSTTIAERFLEKVISDSSNRGYKQVIIPESTRYANFNMQSPVVNHEQTNNVWSKSLLERVEPQARQHSALESEIGNNDSFRLGAARCQLHNTYIVAQTTNSMIIVDQHAAHERLTYEKLKVQIENQGLKTQKLLTPIKIELSLEQIENFIIKKEALMKLGLHFEIHDCFIAITETPALIANLNIPNIINDLASDLSIYDEDLSLKEMINHVLGTYACHHSIRAGRTLSLSEMNAILREMEQTIFSGQCNHGRPTYIELKLKDIENLFGRS